jgi:hypothetical protein
MRSQRSVLALRYTPVSIAGGVRRAVGGFVRYVQFRDQHLEPDTNRALDAYSRYVVHRDRTSPGGRVFGHEGERPDRQAFIEFIARSTRGLEPKWVVGRDGKTEDRQRAVYTFVLSPQDWRGLDLRVLTQRAMTQLKADAGPAGIGPWFAAEHRNTAHHHVHIILAARREVAPGRFSTLVISRVRLQKVKEAIALEIERQRGVERQANHRTPLAQRRARIEMPPLRRHQFHALQWLPDVPLKLRRRQRLVMHGHGPEYLGAASRRVRAVAGTYRQQMEHELEQDVARSEHEGWER